MAAAAVEGLQITCDQARDILEQAKQSSELALKARDDARETVRQMKEIVEVREAAIKQVQDCVNRKNSFDDQWAEFQRKFDNLGKLAFEKLSGMLSAGTGTSNLRPAELISEKRVAQVLRKSRRVLVLTGAGISSESGVPTFRGSDGYWTVGSENYRPQELATWEKFNEMPEELWKWYQYRWGICRSAKPNAGHHALVELESLVEGGIMLVTQNIDGLHLEAGSNPSRLCEIHGRIDEMRCDDRMPGSCLHGLNLNQSEHFEKARATIEKMPAPAENEKDERLPFCKKCGVRQRPKILWFDESYNEAIFKHETVLEATKECDVLLVIGTMLSTGLPNRMVSEARQAGTIIIRIDPVLELDDPTFAGMLHLQGKSGEVLPRIVQELKALQGEEFPAPLASVAPSSSSSVDLVSAAAAAATIAATPDVSLKRSAPGMAQRRSLSSSKGASLVAPSKSRGLSFKAAGSIAVAAGSVTAAIKQQKKLKSVSLLSNSGLAKCTDATDGPPTGFFVYGTLRPDDDSGAAWTNRFCEGLAAEPAFLAGASLYVESFAALCFEQTRCSVRGVFLTPDVDGKSSAVKVLETKLKDADSIEGYPDLYDRTVATVETASGKLVRAYVYHRTGRVDRSEHACIPDGDWLSRKR
eukprot:TRINITY_DN5492_c1_g1_i1.p1 TRINITY_DN5492_c1_g1~~TRINITY_DN5492_c1_g1_i1.p1  ORF type:complete len:641 (+),score=118.51 TRINITY_DN5492_c1_g1_i1:113-2035(+)